MIAGALVLVFASDAATPSAADLSAAADLAGPSAAIPSASASAPNASTLPPSARTMAPNIVVPALHDFALMAVMRTTETFLWPDPFARPEHFGAHYEEAFTRAPIFERDRPFFQWDGDPWFINGVGHALFGSELYLRARQCDFGALGAFASAAVTSAIWEYAFEANGVRPSALDLVWTPFAGALFGELRYQGYRHLARGNVFRVILDPLGEAERALGTKC